MPDLKDRDKEPEVEIEEVSEDKYIPKWALALGLLLVLGAGWFFFLKSPGSGADQAASQLKNLDRLELRYFNDKHKFTNSYEELLTIKANQKRVKPLNLAYDFKLSRNRKVITIEVIDGKKSII